MKNDAPVLVVGQGLAGTLLAAALERTGREFSIVDAGHAHGASRVGAGLVNPVTGERWVAAPGWDAISREALAVYRELESGWNAQLVTRLRIRRVWRSGEEAALVRRKADAGRLVPWVGPGTTDADGAWVQGAWRVDLPRLLAAGRARWLARGLLRERRLGEGEADGWPGPVVWCIGAAETRVPELRAVEGETLELEVRELGSGTWPGDVVKHDGVWVLPVGTRRAWAGASFVRREEERLAKREELRASVRRQLSGLTWNETGVLAGLRMTSPDRTPRSGWLPGREGREGVLNGLGSKGVLLAPGLAAAWAARLEGR